jgi:hypothetical protein
VVARHDFLLSGLEARGYIQRVAAAGYGRGKALRMTVREPRGHGS